MTDFFKRVIAAGFLILAWAWSYYYFQQQELEVIEIPVVVPEYHPTITEYCHISDDGDWIMCRIKDK